MSPDLVHAAQLRGAAWIGRTTPDVDEWVRRYAARRYGLGVAGRGSCTPHANAAWALLRGSVYSAPQQIAGEQGATASDMAASGATKSMWSK